MKAALWLNRLLFVSLNILLGVLLVAMSTDSCASVFEILDDHCLVDNRMRTAVVADQFECQLKCLENNTCKSFNVHPGADNAKRVCELNNKTRQTKPSDFKRKKGSTYYGSVDSVKCLDVFHEQNGKSVNSGHCHPRYKGNWCQTPTRGLFPDQPAESCKDIRDSGDSKGDGKYWIDPEKNANPLKVYCDMTTDGGGWLLVSNLVMLSSTPPSQLPVKSSYRGISSDQMLLKKDALFQLITHLQFTQLRFYCSKQKGSTFHVTTVANRTGEAVVQYFSGMKDAMPAACGSFVRMEDDSSGMAKVCEKWGYENGSYYVGKWGHQRDQDRLYDHAAMVRDKHHWLLHIGGRWECDDFRVGVSSGDFWKVFVR